MTSGLPERAECDKAKRFARIKEVLDRRQPDLTIVMENVHKTHNLAAILRSCDAVGVGTVHAVAYSDLLGVRRAAASGSQKWVDLVVHREIQEAYGQLRNSGFRIFAAESGNNGIDFREVDLRVPSDIVVGAEFDGLSTEAVNLSDESISIPTAGMVDSLNVSVASAVILFEAQHQRSAAGMYQGCRLDTESRHRLLFEYTYPTAVARCKKLGIPYPSLDESGEVIPGSESHELGL